jgi:drug/metabolite transporter (DMT)-like permease
MAPTKSALAIIIGCFVFCGTFSTMSGKLLFQCRSVGVDGIEKNFEKPLFQNTGMFFGMTLCLFVYWFSVLRRRGAATEAEKTGLLNGKIHAKQKPRGADPRIYYVVIVPAVCDFLATYMMNVGLLWINASVWQMVRGSIVLFTALIRWGWLKKKIFNFQWFGVFVVMFALCIIGYSAILGSSGSGVQVPLANKLFGVLLVFFAQMVQATQAVVEEHLLHNVSADALQIVGLEGLWGLILCVAISMPIAAAIPTPGLHEDTWDSLVMIANNPGQILPMLCLYCLVILGFNIFAMKITEAINSVTRSVLDTVRTIFIWFFMTLAHYTVGAQSGEAWNDWCFMQLAGFCVLIFGLFSYYQVITLPCFDYPDEDQQKADPGLATPLLTPRGGRRSSATSMLMDKPALLLTPGSPRR